MDGWSVRLHLQPPGGGVEEPLDHCDLWMSLKVLRESWSRRTQRVRPATVFRMRPLVRISWEPERQEQCGGVKVAAVANGQQGAELEGSSPCCTLGPRSRSARAGGSHLDGRRRRRRTS